MAKIEATETATFTVPSPIEQVRDFFFFPDKLRAAMTELERFELDGTHKVRWILKEKKEKGITFLGDYTVVYSSTSPELVTWQSVAGNIDVKGEVRLRKLTETSTEVSYRETLAPDLPIPKLMAAVFKPIVAHNVKQSIGRFIEQIKRQLNRI
jgi:uncharacterized membrane protein